MDVYETSAKKLQDNPEQDQERKHGNLPAWKSILQQHKKRTLSKKSSSKVKIEFDKTNEDNYDNIYKSRNHIEAEDNPPVEVINKSNISSNALKLQRDAIPNWGNANSIFENWIKINSKRVIPTQALNHWINYSSLKFFNNILRTYLSYGDTICQQIIKLIMVKEYPVGVEVVIDPNSINAFCFVIRGELSLYSRQKPSTIVTLSKGDYYESKMYSHFYASELALVGETPMKKYDAWIEKYKSLETISEVNFLNSLPVFNRCNRGIIEKIYSGIEKKYLKKREYLLKQNSAIEGLYLIRKGSVSITYSFNRTIHNELDMNALDNWAWSPNERFSSNRVYELKNTYNQSKTFKVVILNPNDWIGDLEIKFNKTNAMFTSKCEDDDTLIYLIPNDVIKNTFTEYVYTRIKNESFKKEQIITERVEWINNQTKQYKKDNKFTGIILHKLRKSPIMSDEAMREREIRKDEEALKKKKHKHLFNSNIYKVKKIKPSSSTGNWYVNSNRHGNKNHCYKTKYERDLANIVRNTIKRRAQEYKDNPGNLWLTALKMPHRKSRSLADLWDNNNSCTNAKTKEIELARINKIASPKVLDWMKSFEINKQFIIQTNTTINRNRLKGILYGIEGK